MEHAFTSKIMEILRGEFEELAQDIFDKSLLLQYLNVKTRSVGRGSKSRSAFANNYALYVLVEDYIDKGFVTSGAYKDYEGAKFADLLRRQRELPFGTKLQNHALNHRLNEEFAKFFPTSDHKPIIRDAETNRYWINENILNVSAPDGNSLCLAGVVIKIINAYINAKRDAFDAFFETCQKIQLVQDAQPSEALEFVKGLLQPNVDARLFEIVSFSILKAFYGAQSIFWGWAEDELHQEALILYKTGRTNANDGGIDFVMRPLGRFFQVTETVDVKKYFLDIDKIQRFPLTFIVKSQETAEYIFDKIKSQAENQYPVKAIIDRYMGCIDEIINIPELTHRFDETVNNSALSLTMNEIVLQSKVEFNYEDEIDEVSEVSDADNRDVDDS